MNEQLAVREEMALARPADVVASATEQAKELMRIVEFRKLYAIVGGKKYLEAEAWEIICAFNNVAPDVVYTNPIYENDEIVAYEAKVNLIDRSGALRGSGISECSMDSFPTRGRKGRDKDKAAKSAAQTWAISKAARMAFSWVAVLAEYEPTPASEMHQGQASDGPEADQGYGICPKHNEPYFKRGNMKSPGHKDENDKWCNRPDDDAEFAGKASSSQPEPDSGPGVFTPPNESDGGPAFFHDAAREVREAEQPMYDTDGEAQRQFATAGDLRTALSADFGLTTKKQCDDAFGSDINLADRGQVYATVKAHQEAADG